MDIHVSHMHPVILVDNIGALRVFLLSDTGIQFPDNGNQVRNHFRQIINRPFFQGLRQDGVVGIRAGLCHHINRLVHGEASVLQQTDQLRNDHGRMGVVDLNGHIIIQTVEISASSFRFLQNQLGSVADHKILLIDPEKLSLAGTVVRIEKQRQIMGDIVHIKGDAVVRDHVVIDRIQVEQMQAVAVPGLIARNINVIHHGAESKTAEGNLKGLRTALQPALCPYPRVFHFFLLVVHKFLAEQAEVVIQPDAVSAELQGGYGIQEAGGQAAKPAVAQGRLQLQLLDIGELQLVLFQDGIDLVIQAQVDQIVGEQLADQKFRGNIVQFLLSLYPRLLLHLLPCNAQKNLENLLLRAVTQASSEFCPQHVVDFFFHMYTPVISGFSLYSARLLRSRPGRKPVSFPESLPSAPVRPVRGASSISSSSRLWRED